MVGTSGYFARHDPSATPAALERQVCVNYRQLGGGGLLSWAFEEHGRDIRVRVAGQLIVNDEALSAAAVRAGAGLGYMVESDVVIEIADGRLVPITRRMMSSLSWLALLSGPSSKPGHAGIDRRPRWETGLNPGPAKWRRRQRIPLCSDDRTIDDIVDVQVAGLLQGKADRTSGLFDGDDSHPAIRPPMSVSKHRTVVDLPSVDQLQSLRDIARELIDHR